MQKLRSFLRSCFGYLAAVYLCASFGTIPGLLRTFDSGVGGTQQGVMLRGTEYFLIGLSGFIFLIPPILAVVFGTAWWTLRKSTPSARRWALGASAALILSAAPALFGMVDMWKWEHGRFFGMAVTVALLGFASLAGGIAGLYAFSFKAPLAAEVPRKAPKMPGDGTHSLLDGLVWVIQIGGMWWLFTLFWRWAGARGLHGSDGIAFFVKWTFVTLLVTLVHESAHAIVGVCVGMKFRSFVVGPFQFTSEDGRWRFKFRLSAIFSASGATGIISPNPDSPWGEAATIAAAPFANLVTGGVAAALALAAPGTRWEPWWEYLAFFASLSAVFAISNLIPFRTSTFYSDGGRIFQLFSQSPAADLYRAQRSVLATLVSQRRPRDYDMAAIGRAIPHFPQGVFALLLHLWAKSFYIDTGDHHNASLELAQAETIYDQAPAGMPAELLHGIVVYDALLNQNAENVRKYWAVIAAAQTTQSSFYWLAKCAFHWAENDRSAALQAFQRGLNHLRALPDVGDNQFDLEQFRAMERMLGTNAAEGTGHASEYVSVQAQPEWLGAEA